MNTTNTDEQMAELGYEKVTVEKDHRVVVKYRHSELQDVSVALAEHFLAQKQRWQIEARIEGQQDLIDEINEKCVKPFEGRSWLDIRADMLLSSLVGTLNENRSRLNAELKSQLPSSDDQKKEKV